MNVERRRARWGHVELRRAGQSKAQQRRAGRAWDVFPPGPRVSVCSEPLALAAPQQPPHHPPLLSTTTTTNTINNNNSSSSTPPAAKKSRVRELDLLLAPGRPHRQNLTPLALPRARVAGADWRPAPNGVQGLMLLPSSHHASQPPDRVLCILHLLSLSRCSPMSAWLPGRPPPQIPRNGGSSAPAASCLQAGCSKMADLAD